MTEPLEVSRTVFGIPKSHLHCTFENFKWPSEAVHKAISEFLAYLEVGSRHLLITGDPGTGKTHLSVAIYRWAVLRWGTMLCSFVQVPQFFNEVKSTFDESSEMRDTPFRDVEDAKRLLILDDLLGRSPTPWEIDHIIFRLINTTYSNNASLVITVNQTLEQIGRVLKSHETSRLFENAIHLEFLGEDHRLPK